MPPRIPAANELIADKRCSMEHCVLPSTYTIPLLLPPTPAASRCRAETGRDPSLKPSLQGRSPQGEGKEGSVFIGDKGPNFPSQTPFPSRIAQTSLALVSPLRKQPGRVKGKPLRAAIFRDRGCGLGHGSIKWTLALSQSGCWPLRASLAHALPPLLQAWEAGHGVEGRLPAHSQQTHDDDGRAELLHALLDDDTINGPAGVIGEKGLSYRAQGRLGVSETGEPIHFLPSLQKPTCHSLLAPLKGFAL